MINILDIVLKSSSYLFGKFFWNVLLSARPGGWGAQPGQACHQGDPRTPPAGGVALTHTGKWNWSISPPSLDPCAGRGDQHPLCCLILWDMSWLPSHPSPKGSAVKLASGWTQLMMTEAGGRFRRSRDSWNPSGGIQCKGTNFHHHWICSLLSSIWNIGSLPGTGHLKSSMEPLPTLPGGQPHSSELSGLLSYLELISWISAYWPPWPASGCLGSYLWPCSHPACSRPLRDCVVPRPRGTSVFLSSWPPTPCLVQTGLLAFMPSLPWPSMERVKIP